VVLTQGGDSSETPIATSGPLVPSIVPTRDLSAPVITGGTPTFGRLTFSTNNVPGDTVNLSVENLDAPPDGARYGVWLLNSASQSLALGELTLDPVGNGALTFTNTDGANLAAQYAVVIIGIDSEMDGSMDGEALYHGSVPSTVPQALSEILVSSENGIEGGGLLAGALGEVAIADFHTSIDHGSHDLGGLISRTEHTVNILMNTEEDYNANGRGENPGLGVGLAPFLDLLDAQLNLASDADDATRRLQADAESLRSCVRNTRSRMNQLVDLELGWLSLTEVDDALSEVTSSLTLIASIAQGVDLNNNGRVEPFPGECGLQQIETFGLVLNTMDIVNGAPPNIS